MVAVDTNILVYSHRPEFPHHEQAKALMKRLAEGEDEWAIPWPCIHEFFAIVTDPRIFQEPTSQTLALVQIALWSASPNLLLIPEEDSYLPILHTLMEASGVSGARIHDARVLSVCMCYGVERLLSADRHFAHISCDVEVHHPFS